MVAVIKRLSVVKFES